jgi:hypothetical protein
VKKITQKIRTSCSYNNMKIYTISKKKTSNAFLSLKIRFFDLEHGGINISVNSVVLVVNFSWSRRMPQSEFPIKSYDRLKLRWSNFAFYFFYLFSLLSFFFLSPSLSLISLFIYENRWKWVDNLWDFSF